MTALVRLGGEWKTITAAKVFANGTWRTLAAIRAFVGGEWREVANFTVPATPPGDGGGSTPTGLTATASPTEQTASGTTASIISQPITVTPSGGLAPYTYSWTASALVISSPTSATSKFTAPGLGRGEMLEAGVSCRVTDSLGSTVTAHATISFERS
jgi:hypothetical protein